MTGYHFIFAVKFVAFAICFAVMIQGVFLNEDNKTVVLFSASYPFIEYIAYLAHLGYEDTGENVQYAIDKYPQYTGMADSVEVDHYFAKARITDDMLGGLVQRLQMDGLLENTVIVATGDHFPYGIVDRDALYRLCNEPKPYLYGLGSLSAVGYFIMLHIFRQKFKHKLHLKVFVCGSSF